MRVVFLGTAPFGVPVLRRLQASDSAQVVGVFTPPDRPRGRGQRPQSPPVAECAREGSLPLFQPEDVNEEGLRQLRRLGEIDLGLVIAYGQLLSPAVFSYPEWGSFNFHASLLPRWRGASPIRHALMAGDASTGVSVFRVEEELDTGPVCVQLQTDIQPNETYGELYERLSELNVQALERLLDAVERDDLDCRPQTGEVTWAPRLSKDDFRIDWQREAVDIERMVRAFCPDPGAFTFWGDRRIKILAARVVDRHLDRAPGQTVVEEDRWLVQTGQGVLVVEELQPQGSRAMEVTSFLRGHPEARDSVRLG